MWGRAVECMTATWLLLSPFFLGAYDDATIMWADSILAIAISVLSGLSFWHPTRRAHLLILVIALGMIVWGRMAGTPPPPEHQNHIFVGIFLLMIAIIPNYASMPPDVWRVPAEKCKEVE